MFHSVGNVLQLSLTPGHAWASKAARAAAEAGICKVAYGRFYPPPPLRPRLTSTYRTRSKVELKDF